MHPFHEGYAAFIDGKFKAENPYVGLDENAEIDWDIGFEDARREEGFEDGDDGQPTEHDEWMDYDPDC